MDASMAIYQFLIAVRSNGGGNMAAAATMLTNADGETTSHIQGMFNRTIRFLTEGIKPVFIFDGKPPTMKSGELQKRKEKRIKAQEELQKATEEGNIEEQDKQSKRLVRAGQKENLDCQKLLELMGVPVLVAPCEAEAQAAALCKAGLVYATGTEDMDALTFQTPILLRKMTFANQSKSMIQTMNYQKALDGLQLTHDEFVDLCILLGCDYCDTIRGVGPKTALKLIRQYKNIETILQNIDRQKYQIPPDWIPNEKSTSKKEDPAADDTDPENEEVDENITNREQQQQHQQKQSKETSPVAIVPSYVQARELFHHHDVVTTGVELKWKPPQAAELTKFLVDEMGFNPDRVASSIEKLQKAHKDNSKPQARMDSFFAVKPNPNAASIAANKRKKVEQNKKALTASNKKSKPATTGSGRKRR